MIARRQGVLTILLAEIASQGLIDAKDDGRAGSRSEDCDATTSIKPSETLLMPQSPSGSRKCHPFDAHALGGTRLHSRFDRVGRIEDKVV